MDAEILNGAGLFLSVIGALATQHEAREAVKEIREWKKEKGLKKILADSGYFTTMIGLCSANLYLGYQLFNRFIYY